MIALFQSNVVRLVESFRVFSAEWPSKHARLLLRMIGNCLPNAVINAWCILSGGCLYNHKARVPALMLVLWPSYRLKTCAPKSNLLWLLGRCAKNTASQVLKKEIAPV